MSKLPEPDDAECFVGGVEPDARTSIETVRLIEESIPAALAAYLNVF